MAATAENNNFVKRVYAGRLRTTPASMKRDSWQSLLTTAWALAVVDAAMMAAASIVMIFSRLF